jgi:hypothetical protein
MDNEATPDRAEALDPAAAEPAPKKAKATDTAAPPAPEAPPAATDLAVDDWRESHLRNSPISRAGADIWNHLLDALDALKAKLKEI